MNKIGLNLLFFCCLWAALTSCDERLEEVGPDGRTDIEMRALELINTHRGTLGLPPLQHHPIVFEQAKQHSANMASRQVPFGHQGFNQRVSLIRSQLVIGLAGENVAFNSSPTPELTVVDQWLASQGHRENIENERYTYCGLAAIPDMNGAYYFTHILVEMN